MEGSFSAACADEDATEVAMLFMVPECGSEVAWAWPGQFDTEKAGCHGE
jgi:hypothetical protein